MLRNARLIDYAPSAQVANYNRALEMHFLDAENVLHNAINSRFTKGEGTAGKKFRYSPRTQYGEVIGAKFRMPRHLILRQHGVGRGQKKGEGNSWSVETWWNDYWDGGGTAKLADVVATHQVDMYGEAFVKQATKGINVNR